LSLCLNINYYKCFVNFRNLFFSNVILKKQRFTVIELSVLSSIPGLLALTVPKEKKQGI